MIYVIDNGCDYSDRAIYFVESDAGFGLWWRDVFVPWLAKTYDSKIKIKIVFAAEQVTWWSGASITVDRFFTCERSLPHWDSHPVYNHCHTSLLSDGDGT